MASFLSKLEQASGVGGSKHAERRAPLPQDQPFDGSVLSALHGHCIFLVS
jgi:hypothetical protein